MYICNTIPSDVFNALKNMIERNLIDYLNGVDKDKPQLIQVGMRKYNNLKKAMPNIREEVGKKKITHLLNFRTMTIHKKDCSYAGKNVLRACIANPGTTGLRVCNHCQPW